MMLYESEYYGVVELGDTINHHGILGQHWGKRNGPPYPLDASDHSASERKAGWRKSLSGKTPSSNTSRQRKFRLNDKQKTALKIVGGAAVTGIAAYGTYRFAKSGAASELLDAAKTFTAQGAPLPKIDGDKETMLDSLSKANPGKYDENCLLSAIAGYARRQGFDVVAKDLSKDTYKPCHEAIQECFKGATILPISPKTSSEFGKSRESAAALLKAKFGDNAEGVVGVNWAEDWGGGGHAFNWKIREGHVIFCDYQNGFANDNEVLNRFWDAMDRDKYMFIARLDQATIRTKGIRKYVANAKDVIKNG